MIILTCLKRRIDRACDVLRRLRRIDRASEFKSQYLFYYILYLVSYYKTIANRKAKRSPTIVPAGQYICVVYSPTPPALPYGLFLFTPLFSR